MDSGNQRIQEFTNSGAFIAQWGSFGSGDGELNYPYGIATDAGGDAFVSDRLNDRIQEFTATGAYLTQWGSMGGGPGEFNFPYGMAVDAAGNIFVVDSDLNRIQKFGPAPTRATTASWGQIKRLYR